MPKTVKEGPFEIFLTSILLQNIKKIEERTIKKFRKKSHKAEKKGKSHSAEKVRTFCFGILVKKLAHTHGFELEPSGLKS